MQVILLQDVEKIGLRGEVVEVARGYARNFLLPRRLAQPATVGALADVRRREETRARQEAASVEQAETLAAELRQTELRFDVQSGPTGTLFGSVTPTDIADEIWKTKKIRVDRRKIDTGPIKRIGRYEIPIELFQDVSVEVRTLVVPEGGELPPDEELAAMAAAEEAANAPADAPGQPAAPELAADDFGAEAEAVGIDLPVAAVEAGDEAEPAAAAAAAADDEL
jgi:large subunit ribosomal protein L9